MPLINPKKPVHVIRIEVKFFQKQDGGIEIVKDDKELPKDVEAEKESFCFKPPAWGDVKAVMSSCSVLGKEGAMSFDAYKFLDSRMKRLLVDWTLKDENGGRLPPTEENIDKLPSSVVTYLNEQLENVPSIAGAFGG